MANTSQNSIDYYREREREEIRLAHSASSHAIRTIHLDMANSYREMVERLEAALGTQLYPAHPSDEPTASVS